MQIPRSCPHQDRMNQKVLEIVKALENMSDGQRSDGQVQKHIVEIDRSRCSSSTLVQQIMENRILTYIKIYLLCIK